MSLRRSKSTLVVVLTAIVALYSLIGLWVPNQASAAVQTTLYASPNGNGSACIQSAPCSLTGARDKARTLNGNMTGDILIYLLDGTYTLSSTFQLTESSTVHDSGTNGYNIVYQALPGAKPVLVEGHRLLAGRFLIAQNIYRAYVGTSIDTRQLYVNGTRAIRAQGVMNPTGWTKTANGYTAPDSSMAIGEI